jgi:2-isopropylmalate synthase
LGVSVNILEASYQAVVEGIEYGLWLQSSAAVKASVTATGSYEF